MKIDFSNVGVSWERLLAVAKGLKPEIDNLAQITAKGYEDERGFINLPDDEAIMKEVRKRVEDKAGLNPDYLVVIGMGGSILGTRAVQEAVLGKLHNQVRAGSPRVLFADNLDADRIHAILEIILSSLETGGSIVVDVVSKSGTTTETAVNFEVILNVLRQNEEDYEEYIVVTTDRGSPLHDLAIDSGFDVMIIPERVVGRYSVLSPVGLFPLGLLGLDIDGLQKGALMARDRCIRSIVEDNPAAISAVSKFIHYREGRNIFDLFLFSSDLESVGLWNRQLVAESLGKEYNAAGEKVNVGLTPTVSIGSTDLHSMAQLYLGGPHDKFTTFVSVEKNNSRITVPRLDKYPGLVPGVEGRALNNILRAICQGTKNAFRNDDRPFMEMILPDKSEHAIGQLLQFKMIETVYLGYLLGIDPFNQPNVEDYKKETMGILSREE